MVTLSYVYPSYLYCGLGTPNSLSFVVSGLTDTTLPITVNLLNNDGSQNNEFTVNNPAQLGAMISSGVYSFSSTLTGAVFFGGYVSNISMTITCDGTTSASSPIPTFPNQTIMPILDQAKPKGTKAKGAKQMAKAAKGKAKKSKKKGS